MEKKNIAISEIIISKFLEQVEIQKRKFLIRAVKLEEIFSEKDSCSYRKGLSKGYSQGVSDTLKLLGIT